MTLASPESISEFLAAWLERAWLAPDEERVLRRYYASYVRHFGPYMRRQYAEQTRELIARVQRLSAPRVLEAGCGCGTESLYMALLGARVLGIDINQDRLGVARSRLAVLGREAGRSLDCAFENRSLFDLEPRGDFDVIWMEQAFHHLEPREQVLKLLPRLLAPNGVVVISEPNAWNPLVQLDFFRKRGFRTVVEYEDAEGQTHLYGNERILPPRRLVRHLRSVGLQPLSLRYFRLFPNLPMADSLSVIESWCPQIVKVPFTHYNLVAGAGSGD